MRFELQEQRKQKFEGNHWTTGETDYNNINVFNEKKLTYIVFRYNVALLLVPGIDVSYPTTRSMMSLNVDPTDDATCQDNCPMSEDR